MDKTYYYDIQDLNKFISPTDKPQPKQARRRTDLDVGDLCIYWDTIGNRLLIARIVEMIYSKNGSVIHTINGVLVQKPAEIFYTPHLPEHIYDTGCIVQINFCRCTTLYLSSDKPADRLRSCIITHNDPDFAHMIIYHLLAYYEKHQSNYYSADDTTDECVSEDESNFAIKFGGPTTARDRQSTIAMFDD